MMSGISEFVKRIITSVMLLVCFGGAYLHSSTLFCFFLGIILAIMLTTEWPKLVPPNKFLFWLLTWLYPILPMGILLWLTLTFRSTDFWLPLYPFFIAWTSDTCGYLVGKLIGRHKMWPALSPGKSWEGFCGGVLGVIAVHFIMVPNTQMLNNALRSSAPLGTILLAIIMTSISCAGGFFLSYLKRKQGLKDAGSILPGHGGFLDRFDGVFFVALATAILYLCL